MLLCICKWLKFRGLRPSFEATLQVIDIELFANMFSCRCKCLKFRDLRQKPRFLAAFSIFKGLKFRGLRRNHGFFKAFWELENRNLADFRNSGIYRKHYVGGEIGQIGLA
jgi:hypothetical protein